MQHERAIRREKQGGNGHRASLREIPPPHRPEAASVVVRDALDHVTVILRDTAAIAKLEVSGAIDRIAKEVGPRAAGIAIGAACGLVGVVLLLVSIFLGLGNIIPSVAWRLFLFAVVFIGLAIAGAILASKPREARMPPTPPVRPVAPSEPAEPLASAVRLDQRSR